MGEKITKMDRQPIISAKDVEITFSLRGKKLNAIRKCSLDLYDGETLAIVGESGSGKSVFTKTFVGMLDVNGKITGGSIMYEGRDMTKFTEKDWLGVRGKKIAMVMQDPMTSLNPLKKIGKQIQESIEHHQGLKGAEAKKAAIEMLAKVGIPDPERRYEQYPHEFSGGMRQRVVIAIAAACRPQILICDEPTTALDVTIQAQILQLIRDLQKELGMSVIYITHDLGNNFIIAVSIRRTNYRGLLSTGINQCLIGIAEFLYNIINTQIQHIQMIPGMVSDLTAKFHHSLHFVRILSNQLSQHKEGSMCIVLLQTVQKLVCILSRTIIKGKCDQRAFLLSIVRTILIKIIIVYPLGHPAGLHVSIGIKCIFHSVNLCKTIGIICTICILIPASAGILMPAWSQ